MRNSREIIIEPLLTEKSMSNRESILTNSKRGINRIAEENQKMRYYFRVSLNANKIEIRKAVEKIFNVKVDSVNTIRQQGKVKRVRGYEGKRPDFKKAIVTLSAGQSIPDFDIV
jgi:large subunit ribosomal protein L23